MLRFAIIPAVFFMLAWPAFADVRLLMIEQDGCEWCEHWNREVGDAYDRTTEGGIAPLQRADLHDTLPDHIKLMRPAMFTPTFILLNNGREVGRIEGYPGEHFFWPLLNQLIEKLPEHLQIGSKT